MDITVSDHAMKWFFLIAPSIYVVNIIVSGLFAAKYGQSIYKKNMSVWICYLLFGASQGVLNDNTAITLFTKVIIWTLFVFVLQQALSIFISDVFKVKAKFKSDLLLYVAGLSVTFILFNFLANKSIALLPVVFFAAWPVLRHLVHFKTFKFNSLNKNGYLVCATFTALHILDYAYAADKPELIFPGYLIALLLTSGLSCFSFAILIEKAILEVEVKDFLHTTARLTALGGMAAEIAHELNNPLTVITLNNELVKQKLLASSYDPEFILSKVQVTEKTLLRLRKILDGLKASYRSGDQDTFKPTALNEILVDSQFLCEIRASNKGVKLSFEPANEDIIIECRSVQITQVLQNLIYNAIDALENTDEKWIKISHRIENESRIEINVTDSGPGVLPEIQAKIFDNLFTTKINGKGTGIGLSMSKRFTQDHGGNLTFDLNKRPTTFTVHLPLKQSVLGKENQKNSNWQAS